MDKQTVSFRLDSAKLQALDTLAAALERDRTFLLNEAVGNYLEIQAWHIREIEAGLAEANAGKLISHSKVKRAVSKWRQK